MVYCHGCGKQIHVSAVSCPQCGAVQPRDGKSVLGDQVNNTVIWILAFAPVIGWFLEGMVAGVVYSDHYDAKVAMATSKLWYVTFALNVGLSIYDEKLIAKVGVDTAKFKGFTWLVPVYLFQRAKALGQSNAYFVVWLVSFGVSLLLPILSQSSLGE